MIGRVFLLFVPAAALIILATFGPLPSRAARAPSAEMAARALPPPLESPDLFGRSALPDIVVAASAPEPSDVIVEPPPAAALIGVLQADGEMIALVRHEGNLRRVRLGEEVGGYRLKSVAPRSALFEHDGLPVPLELPADDLR